MNGQRSPEPLARKVGARVRAMRLERKLSMRALSNAAGLWPSNLAQVEAGRARLPVETLLALAQAFGVPLRVLLFVDQEEDDRTAVVAMLESLDEKAFRRVSEGIRARCGDLKRKPPQAPGRR